MAISKSELAAQTATTSTDSDLFDTTVVRTEDVENEE